MEISRKWRFSCLLLGLFFLATTLQGVQGEVELGPSESECRPYIEKALKELETAETEPVDPGTPITGDVENAPVLERTIDDSEHETSAGEDDTDKGDNTESTEAQQDKHETSTETQEQDEDQSKEVSEEKSGEDANKEQADEAVASESPEEEQKQESLEQNDEPAQSQEAQAESQELQEAQAESQELQEAQAESPEAAAESQEARGESAEGSQENAVESQEAPVESQEAQADSQEAPAESTEGTVESQEAPTESQEVTTESKEASEVSQEEPAGSQEAAQSTEAEIGAESVESADEELKTDGELAEAESTEKTDDAASVEKTEEDTAASAETAESVEKVDEEATETEETKEASVEETVEAVEPVEELQAHEPATETQEDVNEVEESETDAQTEEVKEETEKSEDVKEGEEVKDEEKVGEVLKEEETEEGKVGEEAKEGEEAKDGEEVKEGEAVEEGKEGVVSAETPEGEEKAEEATEGEESQTEEETKEAVPEEDLILEIEIPENLRPRDQVDQLLKLDDSNSETETVLNNVAQVTLKELKRLYENAIKPLETLYKYRDLSNRHFGDSEIFSKPLVLFMGPWSGGKSSIINYLLDNEYNATSLRTGAEPSPAYFNLLMYGDEPEVLDGTQLAADFTFAGLQKFGQGLEERLRGLKLPSKLLEKINIVEIPGILEVRKQVSRVFPFNDACQWFIDRADIIFLVYDPSKLDVGPETEAILDQLKGREHQTRIILNKADQVKPEELMRVQGALIWNISPLMSSAQPPVMYTTSLWSRPYESWAPVRLLQAQERAFLRDLRSAVDKRIENKISSARRFAVRVRNHAKMVDCYLTTYYNHKSVFGNRKQVSDQIIEHPQDYHIYEGLSTLTNISRYDLPDPDVYKDFFRLNPLYDFQQLSATCTYFRGCPINRLDVAIAYDLPELVGKHKKLVEAAVTEIKTES